MSRRRQILTATWLVLAIGAGVAILHLLVARSETTTLGVLGLLASLVLFSGLLIWMGLSFLSKPHARFALAGLGLLAIGTVLALSILPESNTGVVSGGIGVLPPYPVKGDRGFAVGLAAHPNGCRNPVPITLVVTGSKAFWEEHRTDKDKALPFVVVMPGDYQHNVTVQLGPAGTEIAKDPQHAEVETAAGDQLRSDVVYANSGKNRRDYTVVTGKVDSWSQTRRPIIIEARAPWITHRGVSNCNLALPPLSGELSALAVDEAVSCRQLQERMTPQICLPAPSKEVSRLLEISKAVSVVTGDVSSSDSDPQPTTVNGAVGWECEAQPAATTQPSSAEVEGGRATAGNDSDCHALATVVSSTWHRDFLLVLIGAFLAVGVHMVFQAMVEGRRTIKEQGATAESK
jgi:hypothetical protein